MVLRFAILLAATCLSSLAISPESWADPPEQADDPVQIAAGDVAELGVMIADSPGVGVIVKGVIAGSPAEAAGVTSGDFIMSLDGSDVNEPTDLSTAIRAKPVGSTVAIDVWRDGKQVTKQVPLAASATAAQKTGRAWMGVRLRSNHQNGAQIAMVVPDSPAARANLRAGDIVTAIGEATIGDANDLVDAVNKQKPGDTIALTVRRDGNELSYKIELASVAETPFFSFRVPLGDADSDAFSFPGAPMIPVPLDSAPELWSPWREDFQELKREMDKIREQLRRATGEETDSPSEPSSDDPDVTPSDDAQSFAPIGQIQGEIHDGLHRDQKAT
jgi:predicted metalloprotease with PDZ domain